MQSSLFVNNTASIRGGGVYGSEVNHCTIIANTAPSGGGIYAVYAPTRNSIIFDNTISASVPIASDYDGVSNFPTYSYVVLSPTGPPYPGTGNINAHPQFTDEYHLAVTSPGRNAGNPLYAFGTDLDGEPWQNPPSMGCDEVYEAAINGPLSVQLNKQWEEVVENQYLFLFTTVTGRVTRATWSFGDGSVLTNLTTMHLVHRWTNAGDYTVTFTAYNSDNTNGVSATTVVHAVPLITPRVSEYNLNGTNFTLRFPAQSNILYYVEQATNLTPPVVWKTVNATYSSNNFIEITDSKATNTAQFYRVRIR